MSQATLKLNQDVRIEMPDKEGIYRVTGAGRVIDDFVIKLTNHRSEHPETILITIPGQTMKLYQENENSSD